MIIIAQEGKESQMINVTEQYTEYCYNKYYEKSNWNDWNEYLAEREDREYEDRIFERMSE